MYQVQRRRRGGGWILLLFVAALLVGIGIGYGAMVSDIGQNQEKEPEKMSRETKTEPIQTEKEPPEDLQVQANLDETPAKKDVVSYLVAEEGGDVCVFTIDEAGIRRFSHKIPVELSALKEADRKLFQTGIQVSTEADLLSLMEDFAS